MENFILDNIEIFLILFPIILIWSLVWRGLALWRSARLNHKTWFVFMLIINSLGILEILYLAFFGKIKKIKNK
ncbi:MAG TPA: DUF5652 family protein [Patescibacteria group bacterium]|nr:DUF5652 family protein [Patescibacteria group bacterium]